MQIYITNTESNRLTAAELFDQQQGVSVANQLGYLRLGLPTEPTDNLEFWRGCWASINTDDVVIWQVTFNSNDPAVKLMKQFKQITKAHIILWLKGPTTGFTNAELMANITAYNQADLIIVSSKQIKTQLLLAGVSVSRIIVPELPDTLSIKLPAGQPNYQQRLHLFGEKQSWWEVLAKELDKSVEIKEHKDFAMEPLKIFQFITNLQNSGGVGILFKEFQPNWYESLPETNYQLSLYLLAQMPIIISAGHPGASVVKDNDLGWVVNSVAEIATKIIKIDADEYATKQKNIASYAPLVRQGLISQKVLTESVYHILHQNRIPRATANQPHILGIHETLDYLQNHHASVARFGDGELDIIGGHSIPYQDYSVELATRLMNTLAIPSSTQLLVCLPDVFENLNRYRDMAKIFWQNNVQVKRQLYSALILNEWYGSSFITRPYMDLKDKIPAQGYFDHLKQLWKQQDILIVEGSNTRSGEGNDLFTEVRSINRIIAPSKNAFARVYELEDAIRQYGQNKLVLLMLGPTAKVIAADLVKEGLWLLDIGHIDSEYEWYLMQATEKTKLLHKHTAEFNWDDNIELQENEVYEKQIITKIV